MTNPSERIKDVRALVNWSKPISVLKHDLSKYPWDYVGNEIVEIATDDILRALLLVIEGQENFEDIEEWANLIELRDDIDYKIEDAELLKQIVNELANPTLYESISIEVCKALVVRIMKSENQI